MRKIINGFRHENKEVKKDLDRGIILEHEKDGWKFKEYDNEGDLIFEKQ